MGKALRPPALAREEAHRAARHTSPPRDKRAGVSRQGYLGHASVTITFDRYGHLFPGSEHEAAGQLDAFVLGSEGHSRGSEGRSQPDSTGDNRERRWPRCPC